MGYANGVASECAGREDAARFAVETGVDAIAVSIGNVHLQTDQVAQIDRDRLARIEHVTNVPLVIHGGSGLPHDLRQDLARSNAICKFNIGTELRMSFGGALRGTLAARPDVFDRIAILSAVEEPLIHKAREVIRGLR